MKKLVCSFCTLTALFGGVQLEARSDLDRLGREVGAVLVNATTVPIMYYASRSLAADSLGGRILGDAAWGLTATLIEYMLDSFNKQYADKKFTRFFNTWRHIFWGGAKAFALYNTGHIAEQNIPAEVVLGAFIAYTMPGHVESMLNSPKFIFE